MVGIIADPLLRRRVSTYQWLSSRYLFVESKSYEMIGVLWFRRILLATPLRFFNPGLRLTSSRELAVLEDIRERMASAEVSHWVAFAWMLTLTPFAWWYHGLTVGLSYVALNAFGNLYPSLLQQYNKRRLARLISALEEREKAGSFGTASLR
jgi:hypothetical protein